MAPSIEHRASVGVPHACKRRPSSQRCPTQISAAAAICCTNSDCTQHRLRASQYAAPISQTHKKHACPCQAFSSSFRPVDSACFIHLHIPGRTRTLDLTRSRSDSFIKSPRLPGPLAPCPALLRPPSLLCIPPSGFGRLPRQCSLSPIHDDQLCQPPLLDTAPSLAPSL